MADRFTLEVISQVMVLGDDLKLASACQRSLILRAQ